MKLKEFIVENGLRVNFLAKKLRIKDTTAYKILAGGTPSLQVAYRIVKFTKGRVTLREMLPDDFDEELG